MKTKATASGTMGVLLLTGLLCALTPAMGQTTPTGTTTTIEYSTPGGPYPFSVPPWVSSITVQAWGGGGAGASLAAGTTGTAPGGGGGAFVQSVIEVAPGGQYQVQVGRGGQPGMAGTLAGGSGTLSMFYLETTNLLVRAAYGAGANTAPGRGGRTIDCLGQIIHAGGDGSFGGGGGAGTTGAGAHASGNTGGAATPLGGGAGGSVPAGTGHGHDGDAAGGAGSGASGTSATLLTGGNGAPGRVTITYLSLIDIQPANQTVTYGEDATFSISCQMTEASLQWQQHTGTEWTDIAGATTNQLIITRPIVLSSGTTYRCTATYEGIQETSNTATLTVNQKILSALLEASPKCYDGTTQTTITTELTGVIGSDQVTLTYAGAQFADAGPGPTPVTITTLALQGNDAHNYQLAGPVDVTLQDILIHALPEATISSPSAPCINQQTELSVSFSGTGPWTFDWKMDEGNLTSATIHTNPFTHTFIPTGHQTYTINNITDLNCTNTTPTNFAINTGPVTYFNQPQLQDLCDGSVFWVDILVDNFRDVGAVSLNLMYDPQKLELLSDTLMQQQLSNFQLTTSPQGDSAVITASGYVGENEPGINLVDCSVLLSLEFKYHYSGDGSAVLEWYYHSDDPVHNQYSSNGPDYIPFCSEPHESYFHNGSVNGHPLPGVGLTINNMPLSATTNYFCHDTEVSLVLNEIASGTAPFSFSWSLEDLNQVSTDGSIADINLNDALINKTFLEGTYLLDVTSVADAYGCQMPDLSGLNTTFTIFPEPEVDLLVNMPGQETEFENCYDGDFEFTVSGRAGVPDWIFSYQIEGPEEYTHSDTITVGADSSLEIIEGPFAPGIYHFSVISLTDGNECSASSSTLDGYAFSTEVLPEPVIELSVNGLVNSGVHEFLYDSVVIVSMIEVISGTAPFSLEWIISKDSENINSGSVTDIDTGDNIISQSMTSGNYQLSFTSITDANGCSVSADSLNNYNINILIHPAFSIQGSVYYHHNNFQQENIDLPMSGVKIKLINNAVVEYEATTTESGSYLYPNVLPGTYEVSFETTSLAGGINVTDAALVNYWSVYPSAIERVQFIAGDVTGFQQPDYLHPDNRLMASDASMIQDYFQSFSGFNFQRGKWCFWPANDLIGENPALPDFQIHKPLLEVIFGGISIEKNFYGIVTGDFNRSHRPRVQTSVHEKTVALILQESSTLKTGEVFKVPVFADMDMTLGALSLILTIPDVEAEVTDIFLQGNPNTPVHFSRLGDDLRVSWFSLEPVTLFEGDVLLELEVKMAGDMPKDPFLITLADDPLNELANASFEVIFPALLRTVMIHPWSTGDHDQGQVLLSVSNFPNPFGETTTFQYFTPTWGKVTLSVYTLQGVLLGHLVDQHQDAGHHSFTLEGGDLAAGAYLARLTFDGDAGESQHTIMIIRTAKGR
ncbi:MAG: YDG domain-containing protein [Bacteroidales bacterium]